jgi:hypothetical protein
VSPVPGGTSKSSALRIVIEPTASGRKWAARLNYRVLCIAAAPLVQSARVLLAEGCPADTWIEMWRPHTTECALRGRLGAVAATMMDGEHARNGSPVLQKGSGERGDHGG